MTKSSAASALDLIERWASLNSHSHNPEGLAKMADVLQSDFSLLGAPAKRIGSVIQFVKRADAPVQVLLVGHMDTVYEKDSAFQKVGYRDKKIMTGPGVTDMKSGLAIMLKSLEEFESSKLAHRLGWEVLLTSDEEIGSPSSFALLQERAKRHHAGLVFEPSLPDGAFVSERKSSSYVTVQCVGKSAHAGRDFASGKNAIAALSSFIHLLLESISEPEITLNVGFVSGGGQVNVVADKAMAKLNIRTKTAEQMKNTLDACDIIASEINQRNGAQLSIERNLVRPPKPFDERTQKLFETLKTCGKKIGLDVKWRPTGGVCDGNYLADAGLPTIDTLGGVGGNIHTHEEYLEVDSLAQRIRLTTELLLSLAEGNLP